MIADRQGCSETARVGAQDTGATRPEKCEQAHSMSQKAGSGTGMSSREDRSDTASSRPRLPRASPPPCVPRVIHLLREGEVVSGPGCPTEPDPWAWTRSDRRSERNPGFLLKFRYKRADANMRVLRSHKPPIPDPFTAEPLQTRAADLAPEVRDFPFVGGERRVSAR